MNVLSAWKICLKLTIKIILCLWVTLTLPWQRPLSYRNQSIDLLRKSLDWFLYDNGLRHERVKYINPFQPSAPFLYLLKTSENFWCSVFRVYKNGSLGDNILQEHDPTTSQFICSQTLLMYLMYLYIKKDGVQFFLNHFMMPQKMLRWQVEFFWLIL